MASTFANASTCWRVRTDGLATNGGGFDPYVTNAGTDYTDSATPIISSTTGTCTVGSTTWTDTGVTFTAAMIGNVVQISAKTGGTATALDYFVVNGYTDAHNIILDRSPCASSNITAATYAIGGAFLSLKQFASSATGTLGTPTLATPLLAGNTIYMRGAGSLDPGSNDYTYTGGIWTFPSGTLGADGGAKVPITLVGYNGRPRIGHAGGLIQASWDLQHLSIHRDANTTVQPFCWVTGVESNNVVDCIIDQNGFDAPEWISCGSGFLFNEVRSTGASSSGTQQVICACHPSGPVIGNYIHGVRGPAVNSYFAALAGTTFPTFAFNTIVNNYSDAIQLTALTQSHLYNAAIYNNTIDGNAGSAINAATQVMACLSLFNNIFSNNTVSALNFTDSFAINQRLQCNPVDANCYFGNGTDFNSSCWKYQANDIQADPGYVNRAGGNYATGSAVNGKGLSGLGGVGGTLGSVQRLINIGAWQGSAHSLFRQSMLSGLGSGGSFFQNQLG